MTAEGFTLTFPSGKEYAAKHGIKISHQTEELYFSDGFQQFAAFLDNFVDGGGTTGRYDSNKQTVALGIGAGTHRIEITFKQFEGSTETWGGAASGDSARAKLETLTDSLVSETVNSESPIVYEGGEFSTSGSLDPLDVVVENANLSMDFPGDGPSTFSGTVTLLDVLVLNQTIDAAQQESF